MLVHGKGVCLVINRFFIDAYLSIDQLIGEGFYQGLIKESESQLTILEQERQALADELSSGFDNGLIEKGSEEWLESFKSASLSAYSVAEYSPLAKASLSFAISSAYMLAA